MTLHPFEKAGLGKAPFHCTHVTTNWYVTAGGAHRQPGGSCDYCGTGILYEYHIVGADGAKFIVGSDCVAKTGGHEHVADFKKVKKDLLAKMRSEKRKALWEAKRAKWAAEAAAKRVAFDAAHPGLYDAIKEQGKTSGFFADLARSIDKWGALTANQLTVVERIFAERLRKAELEAHSEYVGTVGKPFTGKWQILRVMSWVSQFYPYPNTYLHVLAADGNLFVYKGSVLLGQKGEWVSGTFTVKDHTEYNGAKQTVLARPRKDVTVTAEAA